MRQNDRIRMPWADRPDLRAAEGIVAGVAISAMLWIALLVSLH